MASKHRREGRDFQLGEVNSRRGLTNARERKEEGEGGRGGGKEKEEREGERGGEREGGEREEGKIKYKSKSNIT